MSSINSLINPPDEEQATPASLAPSQVKLEELAPKAEEVTIAPKPEEMTIAPKHQGVTIAPKHQEVAIAPKPEEQASPDNTTLPTVSLDTILKSFEKIKTHFPAARIKKIMQSDEDIGKVAQATPVVVGRALEIFMANLVEAAIIEARDAGVRRIAASHVRAAVEETEQFDFLVDVVLKYPSLRH